MVKLITSNELRPRQTEAARAVLDGARWIVTTHGKPAFAVVSVADLKLLEAHDGRELDLENLTVPGRRHAEPLPSVVTSDSRSSISS